MVCVCVCVCVCEGGGERESWRNALQTGETVVVVSYTYLESSFTILNSLVLFQTTDWCQNRPLKFQNENAEGFCKMPKDASIFSRFLWLSPKGFFHLGVTIIVLRGHKINSNLSARQSVCQRRIPIKSKKQLK